EDLIAAVERAEVVRVDAAAFEGGPLDGRLFLLMASIGFDADVVHDLTARRRGAITHLSYAAPILRRAVAWRGPELEVRVDGRPLVSGVRGTLVIANCRQYGGRLDPAPEASMVDGRLDVVFLPARTGLGMAGRAVGCRLRIARGPRGRGREVEVRCRPASRVQTDGDPAGPVDERLDVIRCVVRPAAVPVLAPPARVR
ncbi:MAG: diacylglycerol/lipid kinase family protein, partial [Planctomycetota bacterium]